MFRMKTIKSDAANLGIDDMKPGLHQVYHAVKILEAKIGLLLDNIIRKTIA